MKPPTLFLTFHQRLFLKKTDIIESDGDLVEIVDYEEVSMGDVALAAATEQITVRPAVEVASLPEKSGILTYLFEEEQRLRTACVEMDIALTVRCPVFRKLFEANLTRLNCEITRGEGDDLAKKKEKLAFLKKAYERMA